MEAAAICLLDAKGQVIRGATVSSTPEALIGVLDDCGIGLERIGLEA